MDRNCLICGKKFSVESENDSTRVCQRCAIRREGSMLSKSKKIRVISWPPSKSQSEIDGKWIEKFFDAIEGKTGPIRW